MCSTPIKTSDGNVVGCRNCWQCQDRRINDWVGRCIAETKTAVAAHSVTLTYGRDENGEIHHPRSLLLTYSDFQYYIKALRKAGYPCRYFVAGEYGATKGRAHWHAIVFWQEKAPRIVERLEKFEDDYWRHGHSYWDQVTPESIRYVAKYIIKDVNAVAAQSMIRMSKKPPLGAAYFAELARTYVEQGLAPRDLVYKFNEAKKDGKRIPFHMHGVTADNFLRTFVRLWNEFRPGQHWPHSDLVSEWLDRQPPEWLVDAIQDGRTDIIAERHIDEFWRRREPQKRQLLQKPNAPYGATALRFSEKHNGYICNLDGQDLFWRRNHEGEWEWHENESAEQRRLRNAKEEAERQLQRYRETKGRIAASA